MPHYHSRGVPVPTKLLVLPLGDPYSKMAELTRWQTYSVDPGFSTHTIYQPASPPDVLKMPVLVWGETGCTYNSLVFQTFLNEVASHGIFVVAAGTPNGGNNPNGVYDTEHPNGTVLVQAVDWVVGEYAKSKYPNVDSSRIAVAGHSCGGTQSYMLYDDPRITTIGIFNSGLFPPDGETSHPIPGKLEKPIFYFLGGPTDIAYTNVGEPVLGPGRYLLRMPHKPTNSRFGLDLSLE